MTVVCCLFVASLGRAQREENSALSDTTALTRYQSPGMRISTGLSTPPRVDGSGDATSAGRPLEDQPCHCTIYSPAS